VSKLIFRDDLLTEPATMRERFTPTGLIRKAYGGGARFQIGVNFPTGNILIWTVGPLGWWHDFQTVPAGTSFDEALARTFIPRFYGWDR
jgi:hypothetical protein